jgi:hypothetical protein
LRGLIKTQLRKGSLVSTKQNDAQDRPERRSEADAVRSRKSTKEAVRSPKSTKDTVSSPEKRAGSFLEPFDVSQ